FPDLFVITKPTLSPAVTGQPSFAIFFATSTCGAFTSYASTGFVRVFHTMNDDRDSFFDLRFLVKSWTEAAALEWSASSKTILRTVFCTYRAKLDLSPPT